MCMLCVVPPHAMPDRTLLENSALNNPHGFGFAIVIPSEKRIHAERTLDADASINKFLAMRERHPEGYAMWHSRYATHGSQTVENCHPFRVGGDRKTYLAHNGIIPVLEDNTDRSDTRIVAEDLIPSMGGIKALDNPQIWNLLEDFTTGSKVCVLTVDPVAEKQMYLLHEDKGWYDGAGVWWSNNTCHLDYGWSSWKSKSSYLSSATDYTTRDATKFHECGVCDAYIAKDEAEYLGISAEFCENCGSCYGCEHFVSDCLCFGNGKDEFEKWWQYGSTYSSKGKEGYKAGSEAWTW